MELIVTEKDNAARRIAEILSDGGASTERRNGVNVYRWGGTRCVGLSGHVVGMDFPPEYEDWRDVEPAELVEADVVKEPTRDNIVRTLQDLAREAEEAVIATDYDREGELIGKEAYELIRNVTDVPIKRVRFSSITEREVKEAFANPDDLDFDLAAAGEARQVIDLLWGAALTRFLSLEAGQLGDDFISVGRVQSPTLKLIVDREREIEAFDPKDYWELFTDLVKNPDEGNSTDTSEGDASSDGDEFEAQYFYEEDGSEQERVWSEEDAEAVSGRLRNADAATVTDVRRRTRTDGPPAPFDTTQFIRAAGAIGYSAQKAMSIAEELYTAGYITYPRTDNTVYPDDLDPEALLERFADHGGFAEDARQVLQQDEIRPTRGDEQTTDHPPIHPTSEFPARQDLNDAEWDIYELVVRRFLATCAEPATWAHLRVVAEAGGCSLKANGKRLLEAGYHAVYPYFSTSESYVPEVETGEQLTVRDVRLEEKQTQPPRRRGQSRLIETMEEMGIGTKCLTADTPVLVRNEDGELVRKPIESVFAAGQVLMADGETDIASSESGATTLSFDESESRIVERQTILASERPLGSDERVLEVVTESGSFAVTADHPLYVRQGDEITIVPAGEITSGKSLVSARPGGVHSPDDGPTVLTWEEFAAKCDKDSKLYAPDCNEAFAKQRATCGKTQYELADEFGASEKAISRYENENRDIPVWILGQLGIYPDKLHGPTYDTSFDNPFPLNWSGELARVLANLLGDGSVTAKEDENRIEIQYHNTDRRLVKRFTADIESLFGIRPSVHKGEDRRAHNSERYYVQLPAAVSRILQIIFDEVTQSGHPCVPEPIQPAFVGALFDDEGHLSNNGKAFISNTNPDLLASVRKMLAVHGIDAKLALDQHKLHIRGRENLERFLDTIPIATDRKFYRGLDAIDCSDVTHHRARILELAAETPRTADQLAETLGMTKDCVHDLVRDLRDEGYLKKVIEGNDRRHDGNRTVGYVAKDFRETIYATMLGYPSTTTVLDIRERNYDRSVYDLTIDEEAPNFAVDGGVIVHNSTRHNTLQKLYDRGYVEGDPPRPTQLAMAVVDAAEAFADRIVDEKMTRQLEEDMTAIAEGQKSLDEVTDESREMLAAIFEELHDSREEIGDHLRESLKADRALGPCPECGERLLVRSSRQGSYFVGCDGFPDCEYTLPLPNRGEPTVLDERCEDHDLRHVKMLAGRSTFVHGCPRCQAEQADESEDRVIGVCPRCGEKHDGDLAIKRTRTGGRLVGCTRYPDCEYSLPLPRRGDIEVTDRRCEEHDLPELVVHDGDDPWELGCPICNYAEYRERQRARDLEDLDGIGEKTARKLADVGVTDPDDLKDVNADELARKVEGVSADRVREWQQEVQTAA